VAVMVHTHLLRLPRFPKVRNGSKADLHWVHAEPHWAGKAPVVKARPCIAAVSQNARISVQGGKIARETRTKPSELAWIAAIALHSSELCLTAGRPAT
jgi:hypothetical protein